MLESNIQTPGVYINEINAFPNSIASVASAIPAFIGYTPQAAFEGKSLTNVPTKITSLSDFQTLFCDPNLTKQYSPEYYLVKQVKKPLTGDYLTIDGTFYLVQPDPNSVYYFYNSIRLFFMNGGNSAYIVSVGGYGPNSNAAAESGKQLTNPNVNVDQLLNGLSLLKTVSEVTMYICPDATLLSIADNAKLMQAMLSQSDTMQTAMCILDVTGGRNPNPLSYTDDITTFRNNTGNAGLKYGAGYYPFLGTTVMQANEIDYTNLFGGSITPLSDLLNPEDNPNPKAAAVLTAMTDAGNPQTVAQNHNALLAASPAYKVIVNTVQTIVNILPPSGAMAGIYTTVDATEGPWKAPANISINGATAPTLRINDIQQGDMNVDAATGKSVNAIRSFPGMGVLVWGARTLDGNSEDWRYISVRRTVTMIEQSIKIAARQYVFQPNDANTWMSLQSTIASYLNAIWQQGGLAGSKPDEAYSVAVGLGSTMTADDILQGIMNVSVLVAISHPAEFIVITFQQQMQTA